MNPPNIGLAELIAKMLVRLRFLTSLATVILLSNTVFAGMTTDFNTAKLTAKPKPIFQALDKALNTDQANQRVAQAATTITTIAAVQIEAKPRDAQSTPSDAQVHIRGNQPLNLIKPNYPSLARTRGIEGYVVIHFNISANGNVEQPKILEAKPQLTFNQSALKAVRQFQFVPHRVSGQGVVVKGVINKFVFQLTDQDPGVKPAIFFSGRTKLTHLMPR